KRAVVKFLQFPCAATARDMLRVFLVLLFGRSRARGEYLRRTDHAEFRRRVVDRRPSVGNSQRTGGPVTATPAVVVGHRRQDGWQQVTIGDQCAVTLDRQIAPGQPAVTDQGTHDVGIQAASRDHRGLYRNRLELRAGSRRRIDVNRLAVSPRGFTRLQFGNRHGSAGKCGCEHAQGLQPVATGVAYHFHPPNHGHSLTKYLFQRKVRTWLQSIGGGRQDSVDFSYPAEVEQFRSELRAWLSANLTDQLIAARRPSGRDDATFELL